MTRPGVPDRVIPAEALEQAIQWLTTNPSGRAHTHAADDGQTGWRTHAVRAHDSETFPEIACRAALCGLVPRHGWNIDLFIDRRCARCDAKLRALEARREGR